VSDASRPRPARQTPAPAAFPARARAALARALGVLRAVLGAPDYDAYVAHCRARGAAPAGRAAFERERQAARYDRPGGRCC
jgi:uncharacterized short protein YbdD (DUF466 family)